MPRTLCILACTAVLLSGLTRGQSSDNSAVPIQELPAFSRVQACVPFKVLVQTSPSGGPDYGFQVEADPAVAAAIRATVNDDTLQLETGSFLTQQPIKVVIYLPSDRLSALDLLGFGGSVYLSEGFNPDNFTLRLGSGSGGAYAFNMSVNDATVLTQSNGEVVLTGSYGTVSITSSGISSVYVGGITQAVNVDLSGISDLFLEPASDSVYISGHASGISNVQYSQGQCAVQSAFVLTSPCQQNSGISLQVPTPSWTQGLTAVGTFSCGVADSFFQGPQQPQALPTFQLPTLQFPALQFFPVTPIQLTSMAPPAPARTPPTPTPTPAAPAPVPTAPALAPAVPPPTTVAAPLPVPEVITAQSPYALGLQTPTGSQFQAGSVTPQGTSAQSAATGQRQASAVSVAGPQGAGTQTTSDNTGFAAQTQG